MPVGKRSRPNTRVACENCRTARVRCEASRPSCSRCLQRSLRCMYETTVSAESRRGVFRREHGVHGRLLGDLRSSLHALHGLSDAEALQALRDVTASEDPLSSLASLVNTHRLPATPSVYAINNAAVPDNLLPFQYELMMQHPHAYPAAAPLVHTAGDVSALEPSNRKMITADTSQLDSRLATAQISRWTTVQVEEIEARQIIRHYLETDHPILGLFDADLFLDSLSTDSHTFCSDFLVNCILFWSCLSCSSENQVARSLKSKFFEAANDLWSQVRDVDDTTTVAATQLLSVGLACEGEDSEAANLCAAGYHMGKRLGLYSPSVVPDATGASSDLSKRWDAHVAWGVFNWLSLHAFHYRQPPVCEPPSLPIPGDRSEDVDPALIGSSSPLLVPTITSLCKFWRLLHPIVRLWVPDADPNPLLKKLTFKTAEETLQKLLSWSDDNLVECSESGNLNQPHHVLVMHIWFHTAVMEIIRPFYGRNLMLKTFDTRQSTPEIIFWSSLTQLESLALEYRQNHPSASTSIFWHLSLLFIGNAVVRNPVGSTWRFNFLLCMYSYADLAASFRVAEGFLKAILYMAVEGGLIQTPEARQIINRIPDNGSPEANGANGKMPRVRSTHVADLQLAMDEHTVSQVTDLADKLEDVLMFGDFVDGSEDDASGGTQPADVHSRDSTADAVDGQLNGYAQPKSSRTPFA